MNAKEAKNKTLITLSNKVKHVNEKILNACKEGLFKVNFTLNFIDDDVKNYLRINDYKIIQVQIGFNSNLVYYEISWE